MAKRKPLKERPLSQLQINFAHGIVQGKTQYQAYIDAGYACKNRGVADSKACALVKTRKIQAYLAELRAPSKAEAVASVEERKKRLTQFVREDNPTEHGFNRGGNIAAIAELNKMDGVYQQTPMSTSQTTINIVVADSETREMLARIKDRTRQLVVGDSQPADSEQVESHDA